MDEGVVGIDHVAIVTDNLSQARRFFGKIGLKVTRIYTVNEQFREEAKPHQYRAFAVMFRDRGPVLWIMKPIGRSGPLRKFLTRRGPGLHHVGLRVKNTKEEEARLERIGVRFVRKAMEGGNEVRAIINPSQSGQVAFELVQRLPRHHK